MCNSFFIEKKSDLEIENKILTDRFYRKYSKPVITSGEVRPTDVVPVIAPDKKGQRSIFPMKWGFTLPEDLIDKWIDPKTDPNELLSNALSDLIIEKA